MPGLVLERVLVPVLGLVWGREPALALGLVKHKPTQR